MTIAINPRTTWGDASDYQPRPLVTTRLALTATAARLDIRDLHLMIAWAWDTEERVLWSQPRRDMLIVQAPTGPHDGRLHGHVLDVAVREWTPTYQVGQQVSLAGILNPQAARSPGRGRRGQRMPVPVGQQPEWFAIRLAGIVAVDEVAVEPLPSLRVRKPGHLVTAARSGFYASGTVIDPQLLAWVVSTGLGAQKAYGCGLLMVAPK